MCQTFWIHITICRAKSGSKQFVKIYQQTALAGTEYRKVPKFSEARKLCCNQPEIQTKKPNLCVFGQKDVNGIANSVDPDQTAPLGAV